MSSAVKCHKEFQGERALRKRPKKLACVGLRKTWGEKHIPNWRKSTRKAKKAKDMFEEQ